jgi:hypothetical protein
LYIHGSEEMLAALIENFIRQCRVNIGNSTRKQTPPGASPAARN